METLALRCVSVWLDGLAPEGGTFAHALEWASRLGLPLRAVVRRREEMAPGSAPADQLAACAAACARKGVPWDASACQGPPGFEADRFLRPDELAVVADTLPAALRNEVLGRVAQLPASPVLVCPRSWQPISRVLVLHEHPDSGQCFLESAAAVCRTLRVTSVVLTVARSEGEAWEGQRFAQEAFVAPGLATDFDLIAGWDVRTAVAAATRWRRCSHVLVQRRGPAPWWHWRRRETVQQLLGLSDSLTFLALPAAGQPIPPPAEAYCGPAAWKAAESP
jgi:hypothetical protein